jgi:hypothetical protein
LAEQQGVNVSYVMGFASKDAPMTVNELNWWYAYNLVCYLKPERDNFFNSTVLSVWCDKSPNQLMVDFFAKKYDKDWVKKEDKKLFDELTEMKAKRKNGQAN